MTHAMRRGGLRRAWALCALAPLALAGCGGSGGGDDGPPPPDTTAPTVVASPAGGTFATPPNVVLTATDDRDPAPAIYYTTDLSAPTTASTLYTGPIPVATDTVIKFLAVDVDANTSAPVAEGYVIASFLIKQQWAESGHGHITSEAWRHWDADGTVPASCAKCHGGIEFVAATGSGFLDWADNGTVDAAAPLPLGLDCSACHSGSPTTYDNLGTYPALEPVLFPSGYEGTFHDASNMCIACHTGRSSSVQVDTAIANKPGGPYSFINVHYYAAAASLFGGEARGGYEYAGQAYQGRNVFPSHPQGLKTCVGCHMGESANHTFEPDLSTCLACHSGTSFETLGGSPVANHTAITGAQSQLYDRIRTYSSSTLGTAVVYNGAAYPYWFQDQNNNGVADAGEPAFTSFDEKLLKAAYNYQVSLKEPCGYVHNGTYIRQILHDSIVDLGGVPTNPAPGRVGFNAETASKTQQWQLSGHGDVYGEPFRHWDEDPGAVVPTSCAKCHTTPGFVDWVPDNVVNATVPVGSAIECAACHQDYDLFADDATWYDWSVGNPSLPLTNVPFPAGVTKSLGDQSNLCMACHQGRNSGVQIASASPNSTVQSPVDYTSYSFVNRHYFAAAAILYGNEVTAGFQYPGRTYKGKNTYSGAHAGKQTCFGCHMRGKDDHRFVPQLADCSGCHTGIVDFEGLGTPFGGTNTDYDGDGTGESYQHEIDGMMARLYTAIQAYANTGLPQASPIAYLAGAHPYWYKDSNGNGVVDVGETSSYVDFDKRLLQAAYNYHNGKDPCGDMHNFKYVLQTLYDAIDDLDDGVLNNSVTGATRP